MELTPRQRRVVAAALECAAETYDKHAADVANPRLQEQFQFQAKDARALAVLIEQHA